MSRKMSSFRALLGASVCLLPLLPLAAFADDFDVGAKQDVAAAPLPSQNWITVGGQYSSGRSDYLNRFNGTEAPGWNAIGAFNYLSRDAWDSGKTFYFNVSGDRLGESDRTVAIRAGEQGTWGLTFGYDGISYDGGHNYQSVFQSNGLLIPGIAPGSVVVGYGSTATFTPAGVLGTGVTSWHGTTIANSLWLPKTASAVHTQAYDLSLQRDIYTLGGKVQYGDWTITSGWRHEHKQGFQQQSLTIAGKPSIITSSAAAPTTYTSGGMAYFLQPVEYDTDRFDLTAQYSTPRYQAQLNYNFSQFQDDDQAIALQNPWGLSASATYGNPANIAPIYVLPPNNSAHQIKGSFGANLTDTTRLNANMAYGVQVQNSQFINGNGNPSFTTAANAAQSLQGFVETIYGNVALTSEPIKGLDLRAAYTFDDRDNETPRSVWNLNTTSASGGNYTAPNFPYTFRHQALTLEAGYRVWGQTKLSVNDTLEDIYRSYGLSSDVQSNRTTVKLRGPVVEGLFASLSGAYEERWAHNYTPNAIWNVINATAHPDTTTDVSNFMAFYEASRKHGEIKAMVDASPFDGVSVSLMGKASKDTYPAAANTLGMRNNHNFSAGPDLAWEVSKSVQLHAFYTYQQLYFDESAAVTSGGVLPFTIKDTNSVQTAGFDADWQAIPDKLKITFDANLSMGDTAYALGEGVIPASVTTNSLNTYGYLNFTPLPDVKSTMITLGAKGEYTINPNTTLMFGYAFEKFNYKDFVNNIGATQYANAFIPGTVNPNEGIHVAYAAVRVRF